MGKPRKKKYQQAQPGRGHFLLPGVGDGLVDPDFDDIEDAEAELIESVGAHRDQSEDNY